MSVIQTKFKVSKKVLSNGLTVLVKSTHHIPRVEVHMWYNVGAKNEGNHERGMAHLVEHMMFKGTKNLSESDINLICQKLTAESNAFTSQDYTCYTFRFPCHLWETGMELLAECMQNATFNPQMMASEIKTVIEELRMYRENYQGMLLEHILAAVFPEHPYHNPIIGSKVDLCNLNADDLRAFYKKHYHPANGVLVVVGDVNPDEIFMAAEKHFGSIPSPTDYKKIEYSIQDDLLARTTVLFRPTNNPWYCYVYKVPGFKEGKNHLLDIASLILSSGKSSRLYQRLVNKEKIAIDIDCSVYDFFEKGILCIGVWPTENQGPDIIEEILQEELELLATKPVLDWEFNAAKKRTFVDFTSLLESTEKQAFVIGNSYLATQDDDFIEHYLESVEHASKEKLREFFDDHFNQCQQHKGYLLPLASKKEAELMAIQQIEAEALESKILQKFNRTEPVEEGKWVHKIKQSPINTFDFPKPETFSLSNGMDVIYRHNPLVPQILCILNFKANYIYEDAERAGGFGFLLRTITDSTIDQDAEEFAKMLDMNGISLVASSDTIAIRCLNNDFEKGLKVLANILKEPAFNKPSIEKIRGEIINELDEYWESPIDFIDQLAKEAIYQEHPYHKHPLGTRECIQVLEKKDFQKIFDQYVTPQGANMVIVGDLSDINIQSLITKYFGGWKGPVVKDLEYPPLSEHIPQTITIPLNRDQVVLAFVAPSIARKDPNFNALALLDLVVTGGASGSPSSRLFQLRENSGLFYTIGGSLIYGAREEPGLVFIKTIVANEKLEVAKKLILDTFDDVGKKGISAHELEMAKNQLVSASIELFESNVQVAQTFLFLKKLKLSFNLFDKLGEILSIIKMNQVNEMARQFCNQELMTILQVGRFGKRKL
jgi:zinc protease